MEAFPSGEGSVCVPRKVGRVGRSVQWVAEGVDSLGESLSGWVCGWWGWRVKEGEGCLTPQDRGISHRESAITAKSGTPGEQVAW